MKKIKIILTFVLLILGLVFTACGKKEDDDDVLWEEGERIVHDTEFEPTSFEGFEYASKVTKLGTTDGIEYIYSGIYEPSAEEIEEEINCMMEDYEIEELTDEVVKEVFDYSSVKEFRESVKNDLMESMISDEYDNAVETLFKKVIDTSEFDIVDEDVQAEYEAQMEGYEGMAEMFDYTLEELANDFWGQTLEELKEETQGFALYNVQLYAVVDAIIEEKGINIASNWKEIAEQIIADYGYEDIWEFVDETGDERYLMSEIRYRAALDYLFGNGKNTAK